MTASAWRATRSTSPLRRYVDRESLQQIIATVMGEKPPYDGMTPDFFHDRRAVRAYLRSLKGLPDPDGALLVACWIACGKFVKQIEGTL